MRLGEWLVVCGAKPGTQTVHEALLKDQSTVEGNSLSPQEG
jgi:hypothetical protein